MEIKNVMNKYGEIEPFQPNRIKYKIMEETGLNKEEATKIQNNIIQFLKRNFKGKELSTSTIRALITEQLLKKGFIEEEEKSRKLGMSVADFENLLENGNRDNANIFYSPEMIAKYSYDAIAKEYALLKMPSECAEAHKQGYIHLHDLEYWNTRPNCANWSIPFIARNGIKIDGNGEYGSATDSAKSLEVLLNHMLEFLMAGALFLSGGQSFSSFNVYLAPFCKGRSYKEIKQAIQNFIFNCNCALIARGGQTIFSSINIEFGIPNFLKDEPAIAPSGVVQGVYGDYEEEAHLIFKAIIEVTKEKDANGRYHTFPNQIYMVRDGTFDEYNEEVKMVHELLTENPTIYFSNVSEEFTENAVTMGCRTRMPQTFTGDYEKDCLNVGNFHYVTLNLPLIALESNDFEDFKTKLSHYMDISRSALLDRKKNVEDVLYNKHMSDFLLQKDKITGEQLYDIERCSFSIGMCGLNECVLSLFGEDIIDGAEYGEDIIKFMSQKLDEYKDIDGLRWSLFFSPAESTAHRFAEINMKKYPNDAIVQGIEGSYYLTNSSHIDVNSEADLIEHILNADKFHKYAVAGNICHLWLGEAHPQAEALYSLNKKIAKTNIKFWAFTNDYTYCRNCNTTIQLNLLDGVCPNCNSDDLLVMSRITGYYQPVASKNGGGFNNGKLQEFKDRYRHRINN